MDFEEYYKSYGLDNYPFGVFTSEAEIENLKSIYLKPSNYSVIVEGLRNTSAIVIGERGTGKTALSLDIKTELEKNKNLFVRIEEYSDLNDDYNSEDLYKFLIERIATEFFILISDNPHHLWKYYNKDDRIELSMYLHSYLGASSKNLLKTKIKKIQNGIIKRFFIGFYNLFRSVLNYGLIAAVKVANDTLTKHYSLPEIESKGKEEYFKKIESEIDESFTTDKKQFFYLKRLCNLIQKFNIPKIYIIIDKIDEDARFENDAEKISSFIKNIASDNTILTNDFFHVLLFVWSTPFNYIKENVRTQKITYQKLEWNKQELERVLQKRLYSYSNEKINNFIEIFESCSEFNINLIFQMCNQNPRDLWHILNNCFREQYYIDTSKRISDQAIENGINKFVTEFNYYEYYPRKSNARKNTMDIYAYIKHLLKLDNSVFTKDTLSTIAGTGGSTNNYVVAMENMGLIKKSANKAQGGAVQYEIRDPKVCYAMKKEIQIAP